MENDEKSKNVNQKVLKNDDFKLQTWLLRKREDTDKKFNWTERCKFITIDLVGVLRSVLQRQQPLPQNVASTIKI